MSEFRRVAPESTPTVRSLESAPTKDPSSPTVQEVGTSYIDPKESDSVVLSTIGITDDIGNLPSEDRANLSLITDFINGVIESRGLKPEASSYQKVMENLKIDMGLEEETDPVVVIDRIGGVIKAWKNLSFIRDPGEKRRMFMKLAKSPDSKSMNRLVFEEMNKKEVWL